MAMKMRTLVAVVSVAAACDRGGSGRPADTTAARSTADSQATLELPPRFVATVFAENLGGARHLVVAPNGNVYVNTWRSPYDTTRRVPEGGYIVALRDTSRDGKADLIRRFGSSVQSGSKGGTGIAIRSGWLYVEADSLIVRYGLPETDLVPAGTPEIVVSGLTLEGGHPMHPIAVDDRNVYVNLGSDTNSCQEKDREVESPGRRPCRELLQRAGIWQFLNSGRQRFSPAQRFATGIRNADGLAIHPEDGALYATQHGRDQLAQNWPKLYNQKQGAELPAEELLRVEQGGDYGWPYCYYDADLKTLVLAPEYGGDGKKIGECANKTGPVAAFPAHWAPNALAFYTGTMFPESYRGGAFIAFHGSWNRAPEPQDGYNVVFQPMAGGKASGPYQVFADGFAGPRKEPGLAMHRPAGVAVGPDGALYISDDQRGTVWRVVYR
jgi:glucose/arabinose dehydrogenase